MRRLTQADDGVPGRSRIAGSSQSPSMIDGTIISICRLTTTLIACALGASTPVTGTASSARAVAEIAGVAVHDQPVSIPLGRRARFTIEALQLRAANESGVDFLGSDEIIAAFESEGHYATTAIYGDMDTGTTRTLLPGQRCLVPLVDSDHQRNLQWSCLPAGRTGPLTITVALYEEEEFYSNWPRGFCVRGVPDVIPFDSWARVDSCMIGLNIQVLGRYRQTFSQADLVRSMPRIGDTYRNSFRVDNCSGPVTMGNAVCAHASWLPSTFAYDIEYQITRTADELLSPALDPRPQ